VLCAQPLGAQAKQASSAVQALVSRASCTQATEQHLTSLSDQMSTLDVAMATLVDGMCRLDQVLWEAAKPAELPGSGGSVVPGQPAAPRRVGGWVRLKPSYRSLLATASAQGKSKSKLTGGSSSSTNVNPQLFRAGMVAEHEEMLNRRAAAAEAASTSHFTAASSGSGATVPASGLPSSSSSSSANKHARLSPLNASVNETDGVLSSSSSTSSTTELVKSPVVRSVGGGGGGGDDGGVVSTASAPRMFSPPTPHQLLQGRNPGPP
jgi:hypothetical protein